MRLPGLILIALSSPALAAKHQAPDFPMEAFRANEQTARWLRVYDAIAWESSDLVMQEPAEELEKLGPEWFCYEDADGSWHAVYGRYDAEAQKYQPAFHYTKMKGAAITRTDAAVDPEIAVRYGRAVHYTSTHLPEGVSRLGIPFNLYVRPIEGDRLEVWVLPGGQADGTLVYGGDVRWLFDRTGTEVLQQEPNFKAFQRVRPDPDVGLDIDREENEVPSVGDIFFLLTFRKDFKTVTVWTRCFLTQMVDMNGEEGAWINAERDRSPCNGGRKKRRGAERS